MPLFHLSPHVGHALRYTPLLRTFARYIRGLLARNSGTGRCCAYSGPLRTVLDSGEGRRVLWDDPRQLQHTASQEEAPPWCPFCVSARMWARQPSVYLCPVLLRL